MATICPTVTAYDLHAYREQMERITPFAKQVHIDLMDGKFAPTQSPDLEQIWWPPELIADIHLMYQRPMEQLELLVKFQPHLVIIHQEADVDHKYFAAQLHREGIKVGLAILQDTPVEATYQSIDSFDQVLIFSGNLGYHGGDTNLGLLHKVKKIKAHHSGIQIAWDGGIGDHNARQLIDGGVEVLNVGGFIQKSGNPAKAYATLKALAGNRDER